MITELLSNEETRLREFPVARNRIFLAHAGVTVLPRRVADAVSTYTEACCVHHQQFGDVLRRVDETRVLAARLIGGNADEIALLGPTSLGLSLFANGIDWHPGDEVLCLRDDYPANVYPWLELRRRGVQVRYLSARHPGEVTPDAVASEIGPRTRLVALASCNFLSGHRIDIDGIGKALRERGVLFSLDAIQTLGAFPTMVTHVDMLSADAHKWLLGPLAIGIVFVRKEHFETVRPTLVGAWNGIAPDFIAQDEVVFPETGRRYEPGVLNVAGIFGMRAAIELLLECGIDKVAERLLHLRGRLAEGLTDMGFEVFGPTSGPGCGGITTVSHPSANIGSLFGSLEAAGVVCSARKDRSGREYLRFSPHFYNTEAELDVVFETLRRAV